MGYTIHRRLYEIGMCRLKRDPGRKCCKKCGVSRYIRIYDGGWDEARLDEKTRRRNAINKRDQETGGGGGRGGSEEGSGVGESNFLRVVMVVVVGRLAGVGEVLNHVLDEGEKGQSERAIKEKGYE